MSYILDALRKSESERQQGKVPDLGQQVQLIHQPKRKPVSSGVWLGLILTINTVVLAYVFWPGRMPTVVAQPETQPEQTPPPVVLPPVQPAAQPAATHTIKVQIGDAVAEIEVPGNLVVAEPSVSEPLVDEEPTLAQASTDQPEITERPTVIVPSASRYQPLSDSDYNDNAYGVGDRVPHLVELPMSFQKGIPDLIFNSHVYASEPAARRVMINDHYLRIGDSFDGLRVERISEEGVVLSKAGTRFRVGVVRDWISPH
ncbi:general secretion pathway protein GspB [Marinobacter zhejiangensis]|uniref:General secretion pathway protein B n=1 Tax=Marinobacter zhejiangensis TaxID=488535 RepID=A0A1I4RRS0_9GAMM|nr:general secretion pathway protein GspB [Marinobacter zhejiangensis]SFM54864.1 general secretion pathway protein B [Marinobacter zhejiangensis]